MDEFPSVLLAAGIPSEGHNRSLVELDERTVVLLFSHICSWSFGLGIAKPPRLTPVGIHGWRVHTQILPELLLKKADDIAELCCLAISRELEASLRLSDCVISSPAQLEQDESHQ
jgi:hypothetical protein